MGEAVNKYSFQELVDPVTVNGKTWECFHAKAIRKLLDTGNKPLTAQQLVQAGRDRNQDVVVDLVRAKVLVGVVLGSTKTVVTRAYSIREGLVVQA